MARCARRAWPSWRLARPAPCDSKVIRNRLHTRGIRSKLLKRHEMTESTSDAPPSVWFPSVLEYGGGTMHHAALRGDVEAIAKLAVDGTPVRARGGARRESSARASRRNDVSRAGTRRGFGRRDASACRRADRGFGARGGGADRAWSPRERGGRLGRDAAALHGRQSPDAWRDRGPRERCRRESSTAGETPPARARAPMLLLSSNIRARAL